MQALCFALFACAFNLLIGYVGLLSFGHALYFGWASYIGAHLAKVGMIKLPYLGRKLAMAHDPAAAIAAGTCDPRRHGCRSIVRADRRCARHPPAGHLLCHDHAGAGADDVFLRAAGAIYPWRRRHPGGAAR